MFSSIKQYIMGNLVTCMGLAVFALFFGTMIAAKFDSKWGYVIMLIAVAFGVYTLHVHGILPF